MALTHIQNRAARSTLVNRNGHPTDIAHSHRTGQGTAKGLEMSDFAWRIRSIVASANNGDRMAKITEGLKTRKQGKKNSAAQQQECHGQSPHGGSDIFKELG